MRRFMIMLLMLSLVLTSCQFISGNDDELDVTISGDLQVNMDDADVYVQYNDVEGLAESISIGLTKGSGNNITDFALILPPNPEKREYTVIGPARNLQSRPEIKSVEASLFYANGSDSREYSQGVTGQLTFTEVGDRLKGTFEARLYYGSIATGSVDNARFIDVNGNFDVSNPKK